MEKARKIPDKTNYAALLSLLSPVRRTLRKEKAGWFMKAERVWVKVSILSF